VASGSHIQACSIKGGESATRGGFQHGNTLGGLWAGQRRRDRAEWDAIAHQ
jgi:hypothetical protein